MRFNSVLIPPKLTDAGTTSPLLIKPAELRLPWLMRLFVGRKTFARIMLRWLRPIVGQIVDWAIKQAYDLIDEAKEAADDAIDDLERQIEERL